MRGKDNPCRANGPKPNTLLDLLIYTLIGLIWAAPVILLWQTAFWFHTGLWPELDLAIILDAFGPGWRDMAWANGRVLIVTAAEVPLSTSSFLIGVIGIGAIFVLIDR